MKAVFTALALSSVATCAAVKLCLIHYPSYSYRAAQAQHGAYIGLAAIALVPSRRSAAQMWWTSFCDLKTF
jgi:hypothetical protein